MSYQDKIVLVTGAANGIGRASALKFAELGARGLVLADIDGDGGESITHQINSDFDAEAVFVKGDIAQEAHVKELVETAVERFGRLDVAFNNAGIEGDSYPLADYPVELFDRVIAINLRSVFMSMKYQIPQMVEQGGGAILNMSSVAGLKGFPTLSPYVASKHGVVGISKSASIEYAAQNVRVNIICPGAIDTPMIHRISKGDPEAEKAYESMQPMGRYGTAEEIAEVAAWVCSDSASFVTGATLEVDGGVMAG